MAERGRGGGRGRNATMAAIGNQGRARVGGRGNRR